MFKSTCLAGILLATVPLWCQVDSETPANASDDMRMMTPAPVSASGYQSATLSEARSNYVSGGLTFNSAYSDNATVSPAGTPVSDITYSIWPHISLDQTTPRVHTTLSYSPGFTFYQRQSNRDQTDQNVGISFEYRLSPHVTLSLGDSFHKTSSTFNQPDFQSPLPVSGSALAPQVLIIAPVADQLRNTGNAGLTYQFSANEMIGGSGSFSNLHYSNASDVSGLFDSNSAGGSFFYTRRIAGKHYLGATYEYSRFASYPSGPDNLTQTQSILAFYTVFLKPTLSLSVSGGPEYSNLIQPPLPSAHSWSPAETVSLGWRAERTSIAASYSHVVSGGGGLVGAYRSSTGNASIRRQLSKTLTAGLSGTYSINKTVNPLFSLGGTQNGHSIFGTASLQYVWGQHVQFEAGYNRVHQSYSGIAVISNAPDTNREFISISY